MITNAVIPRQQGDDYQARYFWLKACRLFQPHTKVVRVGYELNKAKSFDDVVVSYGELVCAERGDMTATDYYQVKFHVSQAGAFTCDAMADPEFIGATSFSLLQRLRAAQLHFAPDGVGCRFIIVSPWIVHPDDPLAELISNDGGELRLERLFDGTGPRGTMGGIRARWREHLGIGDDAELKGVLRPLRIRRDAPDLAGVNEILNDRLCAAGFEPVEAGRLVHPYDDLIRKLHAQGSNEFTRERLQEVARREGLWRGTPTTREDAVKIGIRSFMLWAEHMEDETEDMLCLVRHFDNRNIRAPELWQERIFPDVSGFLSKHISVARPYHLLLDVHTSVAFAAGYCLEAKCGADVVPVQRIRGGREVWRPQSNAASSEAAWSHADYANGPGGHDVAVAISVTHDVLEDVKEYIAVNLPQVSRILACYVQPEPSQAAIQDGTHAWVLAQKLAALFKRRSRDERSGVLHLFAAAPNGFMFFLGQFARSFGPTMIYEHDFDSSNAFASYQPSLTFPPPMMTTSVGAVPQA